MPHAIGSVRASGVLTREMVSGKQTSDMRSVERHMHACIDVKTWCATLQRSPNLPRSPWGACRTAGSEVFASEIRYETDGAWRTRRVRMPV